MSRLSVWLMLAVAAVAWAAPEDPDPRFASAGFLALGAVEYPSWVPQAPYAWDGRIVVVDGRRELRRYTEEGTPDLHFGRNGVAEAREYCPLPVPSDCWVVGIGVRPAGGYAVLSYESNYQTGAFRHWVTWLDASGRRDAVHRNGVPVDLQVVTSIQVAGDDAVVLVGGDGTSEGTQVLRLCADGSIELRLSLYREYLRDIAVMPDRRLLLLDASDRVRRLMPDGTPDPRFGSGGTWMPDAQSGFRPGTLTVLRDGSVRIAGTSGAGDRKVAGVIALTTHGTPDASVGPGGLMSVQVSDRGATEGLKARVDSQGRVVLLARLAKPCEPWTGLACDCVDALCDWRIIIARFERHGVPDANLGAGGWVATPYPIPVLGHDLALTSDERILIWAKSQRAIVCQPVLPHLCHLKPVLQQVVVGLIGGDSVIPRRWPEDVAFEFVHHQTGHYLLSATPREQASLSVRSAADWATTGESFRVWAKPTPDSAPVCRFWSGASFAPASAHFYTPYADECAALMAGSAWTAEGTEFHARLPEGRPGAAACPAGTRALYRLYNGGQGGSPNHRYTTSTRIVDIMTAGRWIPEGDGATGVFACIPSP